MFIIHTTARQSLARQAIARRVVAAMAPPGISREEEAMLEALELRDHITRQVLSHLCSSQCHGFGQAIELCETRGDCVIVIICPTCGKQFTLDDDQYEDLLSWTRGEGMAIACGVEALPA